jgi:capsular exopolysaccharide synthesis family protein
MNIEVEGNSISFKKIKSIFFKYKFLNLLIIFASILLGAFKYYPTHPIYKSHITLEIEQQVNLNKTDFFGNKISEGREIETEIDILKSEFLIEKTIKNISFNTTYLKSSNLKKTQLYKDIPFVIKNLNFNSKKGHPHVYNIKDLGDNKFQLTRKRSFLGKIKNEIIKYLPLNKNNNTLDGIYSYSRPIIGRDISFTVEKISNFKSGDSISDTKYSFYFENDQEIINHIKQNLTIKPASFKSSVLKISFEDHIAVRARDFLNSFIDNYLYFSLKNQTQKDSKTLSFLNKQIDVIDERLKSSENGLLGFKESNNIADITLQRNEIITKLNNFKQELNNARIDYSITKNIYQSSKRGNYGDLSGLSNKYPILSTMLQNLENLQVEKERLLSTLTYQHPDVVNLSNGIFKLKKGIKNISKGIYSKIAQRVKSLEKITEEYQTKLTQFPKKEKELAKYERVFHVNDKVYNYLLQKQSELSIEKAAKHLKKNILDHAKVPTKPISPKLALFLTISTFLGIMLAILHTALRAFLDTLIKGQDDVYRITDIPIYGVIPFVKDSTNYNSAYVLDDPTSKTSEAFRVVKTNLEYIVTPDDSKVILVTSTIPNEGKTTFSANLAAILGMGEKTSIILSLDLRRPELHHKFSLSNKIGMSDLLANKANLNDIIWGHEKFKNFNIITSGSIPPNPAELISSKKMQEVITELRKEYDYIVLDTPPFDYVPDALGLIKHADISLFVVKSEFSEDKSVKEIDKLVQKLKIDNSGIILNSVKEKYYKSKKFDYKYLYHEAS